MLCPVDGDLRPEAWNLIADRATQDASRPVRARLPGAVRSTPGAAATWARTAKPGRNGAVRHGRSGCAPVFNQRREGRWRRGCPSNSCPGAFAAVQNCPCDGGT